MFNPSEIDRQNVAERLDMEAARQQAAEFAKIEDELIRLVKTNAIPWQLTPYPHKEFGVEAFWNPKRDLIRILGLFDNIQGLGKSVHPIAFFHDASVDIVPTIPNTVQTLNMLSVWFHTDIHTMEHVQKLSTDSTESFLPHTEYFFDENGNFAKLVAIPAEIDDPRTPHHYDYTFGKYVKHVASRMTTGDFELVGIVLTQMKKGIQQLFLTNQPTPLHEGL